MKKLHAITLGLLLVLSALWGGAYVCGAVLSKEHWAFMPAFMTTTASILGGTLLVIWGIIEGKD